ncbi:MAG: flavodoxin domain-containing protein [Eubacteriales bacterium]|nr:flavodoxin domain-containing protein [Eubacteriales bacterium]
MNKAVVIYQSKYGSTRRYGQWIAEELACPLFERKNFNPQDFSKYDVIIYGGGLYAGGVSGIKLITQNWKLLSDRKVILFTCGIADPKDPYNVSGIRQSLTKILSPEILGHIQIFHLRGAINYSRLSLIHKAMMAMLRQMLAKKDADSLREEDRQMLETYGKYVDFTDCKSIQPLIAYAKSSLES